MNIADHPQYATLCETVPKEQHRHFALENCPSCGKKLKKVGGYVTITSPRPGGGFSLAMTMVCPRCARRIEQSPTQREKIMNAIEQTVLLAAGDVGGTA